MEKKSDKNPISIKIIKVQEIGYSFSNEIEELQNGFDEKLLKIGIRLEFGWNEVKEMFGVIVNVEYDYKNNNKRTALLNFRAKIEYNIKNLSSIFSSDKKGEFKMNDKFMTILSMTAVSTTRGMIALKTASSFIGNFHLPLINSQQFLNHVAGEVDSDGKRNVKLNRPKNPDGRRQIGEKKTIKK